MSLVVCSAGRPWDRWRQRSGGTLDSSRREHWPRRSQHYPRCTADGARSTRGRVLAEAPHTEMTGLPAPVENVAAPRWPRTRREHGDTSRASSLYTEPRPMVAETVEPMHEPVCLAPGTQPVIVVAPDILVNTASRMPGTRATMEMQRA